MKKKILINDGISASGIKILENAGFKLFKEKVEQEKLIDFINENKINAILVRSATKIKKNTIDACPSLKLIGRGGVGLDNIDFAHARKKGLHVINTPAASSTSVAELVFGHIFSLARNLHDANRNMPLEGDENFNVLKKKYAKSIELKGKTIGIIGIGRIGQEVARIGLGLGMNVLGSNSKDTNGEITVDIQLFNGDKIPCKIALKSKYDIFKSADFITLHLPAQKKYVIDKTEFENMKDGAILINTARGGVINEVEMIKALESGKLAAAALDVFEKEPTPEIQLLMNPKLSLSPHIGGSTLDAQDRIGIELAEQICKLLK